MIALLLALAGQAAPQDEQAKLQSCEMTPSGWVCHYQMPAVTLAPAIVLAPDGRPPAETPPAAASPPPAPRQAEDEEAIRQARLIANCADAPWWSLCLPGDRREARRLRDEAKVRQTLRSEVTRLLSEGQCPEAVKAALAGGDLDLAREARAFCKP
jgi:hypothetical protein